MSDQTFARSECGACGAQGITVSGDPETNEGYGAVDYFKRLPLGDLTAEEVAMLGHALRMVPGNACLTSGPLRNGKPIAFFGEIPAFRSLWEKVAAAVRDRPDLAPFRSGTTPEQSRG